MKHSCIPQCWRVWWTGRLCCALLLSASLWMYSRKPSWYKIWMARPHNRAYIVWSLESRCISLTTVRIHCVNRATQLNNTTMSGHVPTKSFGVLWRIVHFSILNQDTEHHGGTEMDGAASPQALRTLFLLLWRLPHTTGGLEQETDADVGTVDTKRLVTQGGTKGTIDGRRKERLPLPLATVLQTNPLIVVLLWSRESEYRDRCLDEEEQLDQPLPLRSDIDGQEYRPTDYTLLPLQSKSWLRRRCVNVCMKGWLSVKALWIKALYKWGPFTIYNVMMLLSLVVSKRHTIPMYILFSNGLTTYNT